MEKNLYYTKNYSFHKGKNAKDLFSSDSETPLLQDNLEAPKRRTLLINEIENKTNEI